MGLLFAVYAPQSERPYCTRMKARRRGHPEPVILTPDEFELACSLLPEPDETVVDIYLVVGVVKGKQQTIGFEKVGVKHQPEESQGWMNEGAVASRWVLIGQVVGG